VLGVELGDQEGRRPDSARVDGQEEWPLQRLETLAGQVVDAVERRDEEHLKVGLSHRGLEALEPTSIPVMRDPEHGATLPSMGRS
jgi:hypothetical protein